MSPRSRSTDPDAPPLPAGVARIITVSDLINLLSRHAGAEEIEVRTDGTLQVHGADLLAEDPALNCLSCAGK